MANTLKDFPVLKCQFLHLFKLLTILNLFLKIGNKCVGLVGKRSIHFLSPTQNSYSSTGVKEATCCHPRASTLRISIHGTRLQAKQGVGKTKTL